MYRFIIKLGLFCSFVVIVTFALATAFKSILLYNVDFASAQNSKPVLILGDSQIEASLNDSIIKQSLNLAASGEPLFFSYVKTKAMFRQGYIPKVVLLGVGPHNLESNGVDDHAKIRDKVGNYLFLMDTEAVATIFYHNSIGAISGLVKSLFFSPRRKNFWNKTKLESTMVGGFRPLYGSINFNHSHRDSLATPQPVKIFNTFSIKYLRLISNLCKQYSVSLIIVNTPVHESLRIDNMTLAVRFEELMNRLGPDVKYWDFYSYPMKDASFYDNNHLNSDGAAILSEKVNRMIGDQLY